LLNRAVHKDLPDISSPRFRDRYKQQHPQQNEQT